MSVVEVDVQWFVVFRRVGGHECGCGFGRVDFEVVSVSQCVYLVWVWEEVLDDCVGVGVR